MEEREPRRQPVDRSVPAPEGEGGYEPIEIRLAPIVVAIAVMVVVAVVVHLALAGMMEYFDERETVAAGVLPPPDVAEPAEPLLQQSPAADMAQLRNEEETILTGYAWVDRPAGVARIPIAEAMRLVAARGVPTWAESTVGLPAAESGPGADAEGAGRGADAGGGPERESNRTDQE